MKYQGFYFPEPATLDESKFQLLCTRLFSLFRKKNHDYGNSWKKRGMVGIVNKLQTKIDRLVVTSEDGFSMKVSETSSDTLQDLANYAILALILLESLEDCECK